MRLGLLVLALAACAPGAALDCGGRDARAATPPELAAMRLAAAGAAGQSAPLMFFDRMRILTAGNSNTDVGGGLTPGSYRKDLWGRFYGDGLVVSFVGTKTSASFIGGEWQVSAAPYDCTHNGYSGNYIAEIDVKVTPEIPKVHPDAILVLDPAGNDIYLNVSPSTAPARVGTLLDHYLAAFPGHVYVTNDIPKRISGVSDPTLDARVAAFNAALPAAVAARGARAHLIDAYTPVYNGGSFAGNYADDVHLNYTGLAIVGGLFYNAMRGL